MHVSFNVKSKADGLVLAGHHWKVDSPIAVMSLVHGFGEHCGRYHKLAEHLNSKGIAVVGVDLRGHGKTEGGRGVARNYAELQSDMSTLLDETDRLYRQPPHFLFGHSMGGGLVLNYGMIGWDVRLVGYLVSAPLIRSMRHVPLLLNWTVRGLNAVLPKMTLPIAVSGKNISTIKEEQDRYDNDPLNHNRMSFGMAVGVVDAGADILQYADTWDKPLRMWHSSADRITDFKASKQFSEATEFCEFTAFDKVMHEMHQDTSQQEVFDLMVDYILKRSEQVMPR